MNRITEQTRFESYLLRPVGTRQKDILEVLGQREMTARQITYALGYQDLNAVKPRLTELQKEGRVEVVRKTKDLATNRSVAVWKAVQIW